MIIFFLKATPVWFTFPGVHNDEISAAIWNYSCDNVAVSDFLNFDISGRPPPVNIQI